MNREIKFRAWDKTNKCWLTLKDSVYLNDEGESFVLVRGAASDYLSKVDVDILLFTGIKDKNGKEIYEGDVVEGTGGYKCKIVFEDGCFLSQTESGSTNYITMANYFEVIGNIYENPELIK